MLGSLLFASGHAPYSERILLVLASFVFTIPAALVSEWCLTYNQCSIKNMLIITVKKKTTQKITSADKDEEKLETLFIIAGNAD